ncbi:unnamed protein product [Chrysodeixis includens]|uniref:Uncharacterized protein n=1 Tax=Chrysodeixis includens TaxID=689277 RepID=A0A9N8L890_CHRIL|nr:unnamed protein product [Chrysodeixis includens]
MKTFLALGELATASSNKSTTDVSAMTTPEHVFYAVNVSPATCIINLKVGHYSQYKTFTVSRRPRDVTNTWLSRLHAVWRVCCPDRRRVSTSGGDLMPDRRGEISPEFRNFDDEEQVKTPTSDDEQHQPQPNIILQPSPQPQPETEDSDANLDFFNRILCPRNIMILSAGSSDVWESMATVLVFLLTNDYLSEDSLTEQCLAVYRQDWSQNILESLSTCMKSVSARWSRSSTGKFTLFLDFLAEYCGDMDYEPME